MKQVNISDSWYYMSVRPETGGEMENHMGLDIFIAQTLLSRTGATVAYSSFESGATIIVRWDRAMLEPDLKRVA